MPTQSLQSPPYTSGGPLDLPSQPEPVTVGGRTYFPQEIKQEPGLTPFFFYDLPITASQNPTPDLRYDQQIAYAQQVSAHTCVLQPCL